MASSLTKLMLDKRKALKRRVLGRKAVKVFAIGQNKSGTSSLHELFVDLGYKSYHGTQWRDTSQTAIFHKFDCFSDGVPDDFRKLDRMFPNARFILQVRDLDSWIDSRLEHIRRRPADKPRGLFWSIEESSIREWTIRRNAHHIDVLTYFSDRQDDFLLINYITDPLAGEKIAAFLGHPAPSKKPHANRNPKAEKALKNTEMIESALNDLEIPRNEWKNDIHCPSLSPPGFEFVPAHTKEISSKKSYAIEDPQL